MTRGGQEPDEQARSTEGEGDAALAHQELAALDAQLERVRRRLYAIETGLLVVPDRDGALAELSRQYADLGEQFQTAYRAWQSAERSEAARADDS